MKEKTKEILIEAAVVGIIMGFLMVIAINVFMEHNCMCYDNQGNRYPTTLFDLKKKPCDEQCNYFGEKEGLELTDIEPESVRKERPGLVNFTLEIE